MLNLFGKNVFARKRKAKVMPIDCGSRIESLENRVVLTVTAVYDGSNLFLYGTGAADALSIDFTATNQVTLTGASLATAGPITGNIYVSMGNGADTLSIFASNAGAGLDSGNLIIDLGSGDDTLNDTGAFHPIAFTGNVSIVGGSGDDIIGLGATRAISAASISIDTGTGVDETVTLDNATVGTNVTIKTAGTGLQTVALDAIGANVISGNLIISVASGASDADIEAVNTNVTGNVTITVGNTTTTSSITWNNGDVGGTTTLTNGNSSAGFNEIVVDASAFTGNVLFKNGSADTTNLIDVDTSTLSGKSSQLLNGSADTTNVITLGTADIAVTGLLTATNDAAGTGNNTITVVDADLNGGANLSNNTVSRSVASNAGTNSVVIGSGADVATVVGNLVITNAAAADQNEVIIDNLTTSGAKKGDVTINNGTVSAGTTDITLGDDAANVIGGNLTIRNQATSGARTTAVDQTAVNGRTGFYLFNVGGGNASTLIGVTDAVTVAVLFKIEDGSGTSTALLPVLSVQNATIGSLNYSDLGGGSDFIDIATDAGAAATVNNVTRIVTNGGSDTVTIGTDGTAVFNDSVFIALGAGNDTLDIGAQASSPAFTTANKFQFDGGFGFDTVIIDPLSIADYEPVLPGKKLRFKITNFEDLS